MGYPVGHGFPEAYEAFLDRIYVRPSRVRAGRIEFVRVVATPLGRTRSTRALPFRSHFANSFSRDPKSAERATVLAHVHIMKTAGQTVCDILRASFGAQHCDLRVGDLANNADLRFAKRFYPTLRSIAGHSVRPRGELIREPGIRFFAFLRHPVSRCISHFQFERNKNRNELEFLPWLERNRNYQTRILCGAEDASQAIDVLQEHVPFVGLVEEFDTSLRLWRVWSGFDLAVDGYQSRNIARNKSIQQDVRSNQAYMTAIEETHREDLALYQYAVDVVYPEMQRRFGNPASPPQPLTPCNATWSGFKRNLVYKPIAKLRQRWRHAA